MLPTTRPRSRPLRVAVLCGGDSEERAISLRSGQAVADALIERGHAVLAVDPKFTPLESAGLSEVDAVFLALHGRGGEDGSIQSRLEEMGVAYTGSDAAASRLAFSKSAAKERFLQCGVPTAPYAMIHELDDAARIRALAERVGFPLVIKPDTQGSSFGVSFIESPDGLIEAARTCFRFDAFGLIERAVIGTEWTLGLLDEEPLPLIRIESPGAIFDFDSKYGDAGTTYRLDFDGSSGPIEEIVKAGRDAARAIGTRGLARVDLRADAGGRPFVLEVNTIPGLTDHSLVPRAALHAGIGLGELCERSIEGCLAPTQRRAPLRGPHLANSWQAKAKRRN